MRRFTAYLTLSMLFLLGIMASCTKVGPTGPAGKDGTDGTNGTDGTAGCIQCHTNSQVIEVKIAQWSTSVHATGGLEVRNSTSCATCHTSQGFLETVANTPDGGMRPDATAATIDNPAPQNCYTCHDIHATYTAADWALTTSSPVQLWAANKTVDFGKGNLCANCHQARPGLTVVDDSISITSTHWGPHHGPQANILGGAGGFEFTGTFTYSNSNHTTDVTDGCVTCHMGTYNGTSGGHNMEMYNLASTDSPSAINLSGCLSCHDEGSTALVAKITTTQEEVHHLLLTLETAMINKGVMSATGTVIPGKYPQAYAEAYWNWELVEADRSLGVHNADYVKALLNNSIQALSK
ncbi:MAG: ammonia-forming cytochrome c nitrite reductase subunit c552 [Bacteroidales bacterium]|nr:ammonia-forming cytochrome c nitrite reductase subunit c552 [Bacteroidales bacterium]